MKTLRALAWLNPQRNQWLVLCPLCSGFHYHGVGDDPENNPHLGTRAPHCVRGVKQHYELVEAGTLTPRGLGAVAVYAARVEEHYRRHPEAPLATLPKAVPKADGEAVLDWLWGVEVGHGS